MSQKQDARDLGGFFSPRSIAIIGVSRNAVALGGASFLQRFLEAPYAGRLYPIHPQGGEVKGLKAYTDLESLPETPDLAMVALKAPAVPEALRDCARRGIRHIHILTAGFSEIGTPEGKRLEEEIAAVAAAHGLLVMGPNCMGPYRPALGLTAWGAVPGRDGRLGVISQSGGVTQRLTEYVCSLGLGVGKAASIGNATVLDSPDFLEYMAGDDSVDVIALYLESIRDGRRLLDAARQTVARKPVLLLKGGESERGAATVSSHTGRMAGDRTLWKSFCRQTGVVPVFNLNEWVDAILAFSLLPRAEGRGVFIVGGGGGNSVIFADSCARAGLDVPVLSPESMDRIRPFVPVAGSIAGNPLDFWEAFLNTDRLLEILDTAYSDPGVHAVIVDRLIPRIAFHSPDLPDGTDRIIDFIFSHPRRKPTVFTIDYDGGDPELLEKGGRLRRRFCEGGIPAYPSFERAIGALSRFANAGQQAGGNGE